MTILKDASEREQSKDDKYRVNLFFFTPFWANVTSLIFIEIKIQSK